MLLKCCIQYVSANLENSTVATGLEKASFHSNPKEGQCKKVKSAKYCIIVLISHASKVMPQILEPKNTPGLQAGFRKGTGTRNQIVSIQWVIEKAKGS